ncbi:winged helix-turn-helix domain-containing protein [Sphingopyxis sp. XHP0097]|uniref:Winged helix-turn-helix domain-containing protein n=1 Tax=Sphingopyxis jiangsuensis TaxID=2871171 RepID=A0ABS7MEG3_9SPHN|nr:MULTISPECIES: winged helix-turn-helix domain-containing protein [Sphingopyxis]MBL0767195.1 winged helix-turn-helix domain-containing protein [Sphingopyxis lutea]MBY4637146.1 winged helix-turn-helix domain-containing protein [Sphingopyxis jiangsuensis]
MDANSGPMIAGGQFVVAGVTADPSALTLTSELGVSTIEPKMMALLVVFSQRPRQLWTRGELCDALWSSGHGSDEGLSRLVSLLRKTLANDHGAEDVITTVPTLGYRLDADVLTDKTSYSAALPATKGAPATGGWRKTAAIVVLFAAIVAAIWFSMADDTGEAVARDEPETSLAILPFENLTGTSQQAFLAEGMTRDLTSLLSRVPRLRVAPYSSARIFADDSRRAAAAEALGVRYIVSGSLTTQGDQLVLRVDLSDAASNQQVWSKRFVEPLTGFFDLQQDVIQAISTSVSSEIQAFEMRAVQDKGRFNLSVYELVQRARSRRYAYGREAAMMTIEDVQRALEIDPDNYSAQAILATQLAQNVISGYSDDPARDIPRVLQMLEQMRARSPRDPEVLTATALVRLYVQGDEKAAIRLLEESLAIDPNEPHASAVLGLQKCYQGEHAEGMRLIVDAEARAPNHPRYAIWPWFRAGCHGAQGENRLARDAAQDAIDRNPNYSGPYYSYAHYACLLGDREDARETAARARSIDPRFNLRRFERLMATVNYPGPPDHTREEADARVRACLG